MKLKPLVSLLLSLGYVLPAHSAVQIERHNILMLCLKQNGTVWQWGSVPQSYGGGTYYNNYYTPTQVTLPPVSYISAGAGIYMGQQILLAVDTGGEVWRWGDDQISPLKVAGLSGVVSVAAGSSDCLALKGDGTVWKFGVWSSPVQVPGLTGIQSIAAGYQHFLAISTSGALYAWGLNSNGQLGLNSTVYSVTNPTVVTGLPAPVSSIACGTGHSIIGLTSGQVMTAGAGASGQLGVNPAGLSGGMRRIFGAISATLPSISKVGAWNNSSMAGSNAAGVFYWGENISGELGDNSTVNATLPVTISASGNLTDYTAGGAVDANGTVLTWGKYSSFPLLGKGNSYARRSGVPVPLNIKGSVSLGANHGMALNSSDELLVWGGDDKYQNFGMGWYEFPNSEDIGNVGPGNSYSAGDGYSLFTGPLWPDGSVLGWGNNSSGQLGLNSNSPIVYFDTAFLPQGNGRYVFAEGAVSFTISDLGELFASGSNSNGQLGDGTTTASSVWKKVTALSGVKAVDAGQDFAAALMEDGRVFTWGRNSYGQLGDGSTTQRFTPMAVPNLSNVVAIACGSYHVIGLRRRPGATGELEVISWGYNGLGSLGNGGTTSQSSPVVVPKTNFPAGISPVSVGAQRYSSYALFTTGTYSWGYNAYGELGQGTTASTIYSPTLMPDGQNPRSSAVGLPGSSNWIVREDGSVLAMGSNFRGLLPIAMDSWEQPYSDVLYGFNALSAVPVVSALSSSLASPGMHQTTTISAAASDPDGTPITEVTFYHEGVELARDSSPPFQINFQPSTWGQFRIAAVAESSGQLSARNHTLTLTVPYDFDSDGLPDWWEMKNLGGNLNQSPSGDFDNDGLSNAQEYALSSRGSVVAQAAGGVPQFLLLQPN